jgi:Tol biopolymer transport system component
MSPTWLPGDSEIVFFNLSYMIYLLNLNTGLISLLVNMDFARFTAITKDGRFLYFDASGNDTIWSMTIYRKNLTTGDIDTLIGGEYPTLSPDEKWLAFGRYGIFIYNLDKDSLVRLSPFGEFPCWSPTRDEIVYAYIPPGRGSYDIYITDLLGNRHKIMANGCFPRFSPDGNRIVYDADSNDNLTHIWLMNRDGGGKRQITF